MRSTCEGEASEGVRSLVVGLVLALAQTTAGAAHERPAVTQTAVSAEQSAAAKAPEPPKGGMGEGITVHGHWTIEVRNPDGTLASRNEFENHLQNPGTLAQILAGRVTVGSWILQLFSAPPGMFPGINGLPGQAWLIAEDPRAVGGAPGLTKDTPLNGPNTNKLVLSGSVKATYESQLWRVNTYLDHCEPTMPASPTPICGNIGSGVNSLGEFTGCDLPGPHPILAPCAGITVPVDVKANQTVDVTVVISFS